VVRGWWKRDDAQVLPLDLSRIMNRQGGGAPALRDRDLIVVPRSGIAKLGYILQQITPALTVITMTQALNY
jgi:hypothetical protein